MASTPVPGTVPVYHGNTYNHGGILLKWLFGNAFGYAVLPQVAASNYILPVDLPVLRTRAVMVLSYMYLVLVMGVLLVMVQECIQVFHRFLPDW